MIKVAGIIKKNNKFIVVRKENTDRFIIPGGQIEDGETNYQALERELDEELGVQLWLAIWFEDFLGLSAFEGLPLEIRVYEVEVKGEPHPDSEIVELAWIGRDYNTPVGGMLSGQIIPAMIKANII